MAEMTNNLNKALVWKSYPKILVKSVIEDFVHFSAKVVNSNALPAGVRLAKNQRLSLPYVAVRTIGPEVVPLDYVKNAGAVATIAKLFQLVTDKDLHVVFKDAPEDEVAFYAECQILTNSYHELGLNNVGKRLRQIIVQTIDGNNLAVTPMTSAGFGALLQKRIQEEKEEADDPKHFNHNKRPHGLLRIGGANPQNVGQHVRTLQRPLWFSLPQVDQNYRKAYAFYFRGVSLDIPQGLIADYDQKRDRQSSSSEMRSVAVPRDFNADDWFMQRYVGAIQERANEARDLLRCYRESLPGKQLLDRSVPPEVCAMIDPQQQYSGWRSQLAMKLYLIVAEKTIAYDKICKPDANVQDERRAHLLFKIEEALETITTTR